jgi:hypothetical protein
MTFRATGGVVEAEAEDLVAEAGAAADTKGTRVQVRTIISASALRSQMDV